MRNRYRPSSRPIALSAHLLLACAIAGGVRANAESEPHAETAHAEPAHAEPAQAESAHAESTHAAPTHVASAESVHEKPAAAAAAPAPSAAHGEAAREKAHGETAAAESGSSIREHLERGAPMDLKSLPEERSEGVTPTEAASLLKLGNRLTERGDYASAEIAYRQILSASNATVEDTKSALLSLAHMHRKEGTNLTKAAAIYEKYLKEYPGDDRSPECLLELGRTLRSMGAYKMAIARFYNVINSTLKVSGEGFDRYQLLARTAQFEIAETYLESGNYTEASKFFTRLRLLELAPVDRARAHFKAAFAQHMGGDLDGAVQAFRSYLEQWPNDENTPEARYWLALDLRATKRAQEALTVTLELLRAEKERVASDSKRWLYWQRRTGNQLANDFFENGDIANAQAIYIGLSTLSAEPLWKLPLSYQIGLCRERLGDPEGARASYQSIIDAAGATPPPDLAEVVRMASWRMEQIAWREKTVHQVASYFETNTGHMNTSATAVPAKPAAEGSLDVLTPNRNTTTAAAETVPAKSTSP